jgi:hypothetical protein
MRMTPMRRTFTDAEQVELMDLRASNIRVAECLAHIPDVKVLQAQLHHAVQVACERAARATALSLEPGVATPESLGGKPSKASPHE